MKRKQHHIQKQVFDFEFSTKSQALQWQRSISFDGWRRISGILSSLLDHHDDGRNYLIDRIELDLGSVSEADISDKIQQIFNRSLSTVLNKSASHKSLKFQQEVHTYEDLDGPDGKNVLFRSFVFFLRNGFFPWHEEISSVTQLENHVSEKWPQNKLSGLLMAENVLDDQKARTRIYHQFSRPFAKGILRDYFDSELRELEFILHTTDRALKAEVSPTASDREIAAMRGYVLQWVALESDNNPKAWPSQFASSYLKRQFTAMGMAVTVAGNRILRSIDLNDKKRPERKKELIRVIRGLGAVYKRLKADKAEGIASPEAEDPLFAQEMPGAAGMPDNGLPEDYPAGDALIEKDIPRDKVKTPGHEEVISGDKDPDSNKGSLETARQEQGDKLSRYSIEKSGSPSTEFTDTGEQTPAPIEEKTRPPLSHTELYAAEPDINAGDPYFLIEGVNEMPENGYAENTAEFYISHSGLILTWPYLSTMFGKLRYTGHQQFVTKALRERAVLLLGYIATGDSACEEPLLLLAKILCGWPHQMPVRKDLSLTKEEVEEANAMLHSLIANWRILKKTSVEGLRETFIAREGKLQFQEGHWKLAVEQKGTDILLDHLPYMISVIKLPWLKYLFKVDWA